MDITLTPAVAAGIAIILAFLYFWIKNRGVVPGPTGLPYLGLYSYLTDENAPLMLEEYKKKYGDVFSFTYAGRLYINMGSIKAIREIILNKSDCFMERFKDTHILTTLTGNGILFASGEQWKTQRKFFIQKFKEYGLNTVRDSMAGPVYDSLNTTIEDLKKADGKPINIVEFLMQRSEFTMRKTLFGENGITDEDLVQVFTSYAQILDGTFGVYNLLIGPLARLTFAMKPIFRTKMKSYKHLIQIIIDSCQKMERSMDEENPTCIIEEFYKERNKRRRENDPTWKYFSDEALVDTMLQFIGDGIQTVAGFIAGFLNVLFEHPDEQEKLYSEMMEVIGPNRQPSAEDKANLPYTNAFVNEYIRHTPMVTFFPSVECTKETTIRGYRIPVGSITLYNFRLAHMDPNTFEDPEAFNPSRYLSTPEKPKAELPVLFGIGKRSCSGEAFVMLQTFLFLTTIVKNFKIVASNAPATHAVEFLVSGKLELTFVPRTEK